MHKHWQQELEPQKKFTAPSIPSENLNQDSVVHSIFSSLFAEDLPDVWKYLKKNVIKQWIMNGLFDVIVNGARTWIFGENNTPQDSSTVTSLQSQYIDYTQPKLLMASKKEEPKTKVFNPSSQSFANRGAAELALSQMKNAIVHYDSVNVGDFCDICGIDCDFTCYNYGWTNLDSAYVVTDRNGYHIQFPPAKPIERK